MQFGRVVAMAASLLLVGCTPTAPPTTPAPAPTFICTPEAGGAQRTCSQQDFEKMKAKDAQYAEAEKVYREYQAEYERAIRAGGAKSLTPRLKEILGTPELRVSLLKQLKEFKTQGLHIKGPGIQIKTVARKPTSEMNGSAVAMSFCIDSSETKVLQGKEHIRNGGVAEESAYFALRDAVWRIVATTFKEVEKC